MNEECPTCEGEVVHPETVGFLCEEHLPEFFEWHSEQVALGNIKPWFLAAVNR